jgi:hypothetical protein
MATNQLKPLLGAGLIGGDTGKVVMGFDRGDPGLFNRAFVPQDNQGASEREIGGQGFDGEGIEVAGFDSSMSGLAVDKKGVLGRASKAWAWANRWGWLPLIWRR